MNTREKIIEYKGKNITIANQKHLPVPWFVIDFLNWLLPGAIEVSYDGKIEYIYRNGWLSNEWKNQKGEKKK